MLYLGNPTQARTGKAVVDARPRDAQRIQHEKVRPEIISKFSGMGWPTAYRLPYRR